VTEKKLKAAAAPLRVQLSSIEDLWDFLLGKQEELTKGRTLGVC
jgi:hypothetical protein